MGWSAEQKTWRLMTLPYCRKPQQPLNHECRIATLNSRGIIGGLNPNIENFNQDPAPTKVAGLGDVLVERHDDLHVI